MAKYGFKYFRTKFMDVPRWAGVHSLGRIYQYIKVLTLALTHPQRVASEPKTFDEMMQDLSLTDSDINKLKAHKKFMATIYAVLFWCGFVYWLYLLYEAHWVAVIMMTSFQFLMFSFYFRESFWFVQLNQRKLGLSFKDWMREVVKES